MRLDEDDCAAPGPHRCNRLVEALDLVGVDLVDIAGVDHRELVVRETDVAPDLLSGAAEPVDRLVVAGPDDDTRHSFGLQLEESVDDDAHPRCALEKRGGGGRVVSAGNGILYFSLVVLEMDDVAASVPTHSV
jgi:hypothetical protein